MTIRLAIGLEYPTILTPSDNAGDFQGWGVRIG
jgi:hypothetical protein